MGGAIKLPGFTIVKGWGLHDAALSYSEGDDRWALNGGLRTPWFGVEGDGSVAMGLLDALHIAITGKVPLGDSGFTLTKLGGGVSGLSRLPGTSLKLNAIASGNWGQVPKLDVAVIYLKDVTLTIDLAGKVSLDGNVTLVREDSSPVKGELHLTLALSPLKFSGDLDVEAGLVGAKVKRTGGITITPSHFTALGDVSAEFRGQKLAAARGAVSDKGIGATGRLCVIHVCEDVGFGMNWADIPIPHWIGGDVNQFTTVSRARPHGTPIVVSRGRPFLFVEALGPAGPPALTITSPSGRVYKTTAPARRDELVYREPTLRATSVTIVKPLPGTWRIASAGASRVVTQSIRPMRRVHVTTLSPGTSRAHRLGRSKSAILRWASSGLPSDTRVTVEVAPAPKVPWRVVRAGMRTNGSARIPAAKLSRGRNVLHLVVTERGQIVDDVASAKAVWR